APRAGRRPRELPDQAEPAAARQALRQADPRDPRVPRVGGRGRDRGGGGARRDAACRNRGAAGRAAARGAADRDLVGGGVRMRGGGRLSGRPRHDADGRAQARRARARARARGAGGAQAGRPRGRRSHRARDRGRRGRGGCARRASRLRDERDARKPLGTPGGGPGVRRRADGRGAEVDHPAGQGGRRMTARRWLSLRAGASDWLWVSLAVIVLDQATKFAITRSLREFDEIVLLPVLSIVRLHNEGAAFSFLSEASGWQRWFFTALAIAVSIGILIWLRR